jgi:hypothetical protein
MRVSARVEANRPDLDVPFLLICFRVRHAPKDAATGRWPPRHLTLARPALDETAVRTGK